MMKPNGKHGVVTNGNLYTNLYEAIQDIDAWLKYCFKNGPRPPGTPTVRMDVRPTTMVFRVTASAGGRAIDNVELYYASQMTLGLQRFMISATSHYRGTAWNTWEWFQLERRHRQDRRSLRTISSTSHR
jgi:hypothetical protein